MRWSIRSLDQAIVWVLRERPTAQARFCDECGSAVSPLPPIGEHKQVTVLFADVVGSMRLAAAVDAERLQEIMNDLFIRSSSSAALSGHR